jgi:hypothetical protein
MRTIRSKTTQAQQMKPIRPYTKLTGIDGTRTISVEQVEGLLQFGDLFLAQARTIDVQTLGHFGLQKRLRSVEIDQK